MLDTIDWNDNLDAWKCMKIATHVLLAASGRKKAGKELTANDMHIIEQAVSGAPGFSKAIFSIHEKTKSVESTKIVAKDLKNYLYALENWKHAKIAPEENAVGEM